MDRLPSAQHPDNCDCPQCVTVPDDGRCRALASAAALAGRLGVRLAATPPVCKGYANGCTCEASCERRAAGRRAARSKVVVALREPLPVEADRADPLRPRAPKYAARAA